MRSEIKATGDLKRLEARYAQLAADLAAAPPVSGRLEAVAAELASVLTDKRLRDCEGWVASSRLRAVCIERVSR